MKESRRKRKELREECLRAYHAGDPIGDVGILKFAAQSEPLPRGMDERLDHLRGYVPVFDLDTLRELPEGTFGRAYVKFLEDNGIQHMSYSPEMLERFRDVPYVLRIAMTHDIHHMLIGGDAGIAGETAVAAFQAAQGSLGQRWLAVVVTLALALKYTVERPSRTFRVWANLVNGWRLGRKTPLLIAHRLEEMFHLRLEEVRRRVGLPEEPGSPASVTRTRSMARLFRLPSTARLCARCRTGRTCRANMSRFLLGRDQRRRCSCGFRRKVATMRSVKTRLKDSVCERRYPVSRETSRCWRTLLGSSCDEQSAYLRQRSAETRNADSVRTTVVRVTRNQVLTEGGPALRPRAPPVASLACPRRTVRNRRRCCRTPLVLPAAD